MEYNIHSITQAIVSIGALTGTFVLIGMGKIEAEQGLALVMALLGGLGLGYGNGRKSVTT